MKKLLLLIFLFSFSFCEGQSWVWAVQSKNLKYNSNVDPISIATDKSGNIYETGGFQDTVVFGLDTLMSDPSNGGMYLAKYSPNGNLIWIRSYSATLYNFLSPWYASCDSRNNVFLTGSFMGNVTLGSVNLSTGFNEDAFIIKLDSNGTTLWGKSATINNTNYMAVSNSIAVDDSGNAFIVGDFYGTIYFGLDTLINKHPGDQSAFLVKYSASGIPQWAKYSKSFKATYVFGNSVAIDKMNNIYLTGTFYDTLSFDSITTINRKDYDIYLTKFSPYGKTLWLEAGTLNGYQSLVFNNNCNPFVAVDSSNNIYVSATYQDTISFGSILLKTDTNIHELANFLVKYSQNGLPVWALSTSSNGSFYGTMTIDNQNNIYWSGTCGYFPFRLAGLSLNDTGSGAQSYIVKMDSNGHGLCGLAIDNANDDENPVLLDPLTYDIYFSGDSHVGDYLVFGTDTITNYSSIGEYGFLTKLKLCNNIIITSNNISNSISSSLSLFPNPNSGAFTIQVESEKYKVESVEVYNMMGEKVYSSTYSLSTNHYSLDLSSQPSGVYLYRVMDKSGALVGEGKFVIQK